MSIQVLRPGLMTTIQDLGRYGFQKFGVLVGGAMDQHSLRIANLLVGNKEGEGALEVNLFGTTLQFNEDTLIAITGGDLQASIDGIKAPTWRPLLIRSGEVLTFTSAIKGCRAYIAFAGGIQVPEVMGSKSTYIRAQIGGFYGKALQKGDRFECGMMNERNEAIFSQLQKCSGHVAWSVNGHPFVNMNQARTIRVLRGTEYEYFDKDSQQTLFQETYEITSQADRMGYRLEGPPLTLNEPLELLSEGVTYGTIQIPPNGKPIILMADRQTTGGYPKIGQVISTDLAHLAQFQPLDEIKFKEVSMEEAEYAFINNEKAIHKIRLSLQLKFPL